MRAVIPLMANTAGFAYFGRSDNTTFGRGLALFNLRLAMLCWTASTAPSASGSGEMQWRAFSGVPRARDGWLRVNNSRAEEQSDADRWGRDPYTDNSVYSAASVSYLLLGEALAVGTGVSTTGEARRARLAVSRDLGLVRLGRPASRVSGLGIDRAIRRFGCARQPPLSGAHVAPLGMRGQAYHWRDPTYD